MFEAVLVIYIYAGMMSKNDSVTITHIPMPTIAVCEREAKKTAKLVAGTTKSVETVCLNVKP